MIPITQRRHETAHLLGSPLLRWVPSSAECQGHFLDTPQLGLWSLRGSNPLGAPLSDRVRAMRHPISGALGPAFCPMGWVRRETAAQCTGAANALRDRWVLPLGFSPPPPSGPADSHCRMGLSCTERVFFVFHPSRFSFQCSGTLRCHPVRASWASVTGFPHHPPLCLRLTRHCVPAGPSPSSSTPGLLPAVFVCWAASLIIYL